MNEIEEDKVADKKEDMPGSEDAAALVVCVVFALVAGLAYVWAMS